MRCVRLGENDAKGWKVYCAKRASVVRTTQCLLVGKYIFAPRKVHSRIAVQARGVRPFKCKTLLIRRRVRIDHKCCLQ